MRLFHSHRWKVTGVTPLTRYQPVFALQTMITCPITKVLFVCDCSKVKTETLDGTWTLEQLQPQPAQQEADRKFFRDLGVKV